MYDQMSLDTDPREVLLHPSGEGSHKIRHYETGRSIQDGEIIDIVSDDPSAAPSMDIWELQWDLLRMARLCGAAEAANDPSWDPPMDGPALSMIIPEEEEAKRRRDEA